MGATKHLCGVSPSAEWQGVRGKSVLANSIWSYVGAGVGLIATLVTTPIYVRALGLEQYGVVAILLAVVAPMGVLNAGVTEATIKYVAGYSAEGRLSAARDALLASLMINVVVGLLGVGACMLMASRLVLVGFKLDPARIPEAEAALRLLGGVWFVSQIAGTFRAALEGLRDQRRVLVGDTIQIVMTAVACVILVSATRKVTGFIWGQLIAGGVMTLVWFVAARLYVGPLARNIRSSWGHLRQTFRYSMWYGINAGVALLANVGDRYFISLFLSVSALGAYSVALRLQSACRMMFYSVNRVLFPAASAAAAEAGASEQLVLDTTWVLSLLAGMGLGLVFVVGPAFLALWVGPEIAVDAGPALRILVATLFFEIGSATGSSYLNAHGMTRLTALNNVLTTVVVLGLMIPFGRTYGLFGVAISGFVGLVCTRPLLHYWLFRERFRFVVSLGSFLKAFYGVSGSCLVTAAAVIPLFNVAYAGESTLPRFMLVSGLAGIVHAVLVVLVISFVLRDGTQLASCWIRVRQVWRRTLLLAGTDSRDRDVL